MYAPVMVAGTSALEIAAGLVVLFVVLLMLKFVLRLAWRVLSVGCFFVVLLALAAAVAVHFWR